MLKTKRNKLTSSLKTDKTKKQKQQLKKKVQKFSHRSIATTQKQHLFKRVPLHTNTRRKISIFDAPGVTESKPNQVIEFLDDQYDDQIQQEIDQNFSVGALDLSGGKVIFDARTSLHNFVRYRVVAHTATPYNNGEQKLFEEKITTRAKKTLSQSAKQDEEKVYYSFQQVYDDGDEENCDEPYINIKSVVSAGSDNITNLHLASSAAIINALTFITNQPQTALYIGGWGGVIPHYLAKRLGANVEIVDADSMSMYMSKCYAPNIFFDGVGTHGSVLNAKEKIKFEPELPEHPFDIIFEHKMKQLERFQHDTVNGTAESMVDAISAPPTTANPGVKSPNLNPLLRTTQPHQNEVDEAHFDVALQHSIASFQQARQRNQNTGKITYHPSAIDTASHIRSLYSQHYLNDNPENGVYGNMPQVITLMQKTKHLNFLKQQREQTQNNLYALIFDKFNLQEFLQLDVNNVAYRARVERDETTRKLQIANQQFKQAPTLKEKHAIQEQIDVLTSKVKQLDHLLAVGDSSDRQRELEMAEKILKWIKLRMEGLDQFNTTPEIWGDDQHDQDASQDSTKSNIDGDDDVTAQNKKKKQEDEMLKIFDDSELCFAEKFNQLFIKNFINDGDDEVTDGDDVDEEVVRNPKTLAQLYDALNVTQTMDAVWFQSAIHTFSRYNDSIEKYEAEVQRLKDDIKDEKLRLRELSGGKKNERSDDMRDADDEKNLVVLSTIHENILDSIFLPMKTYDLIIHDHDNDPIIEDTTLRQIKEALIMENDDDVVRYGLFVKRIAIVPPHVQKQFSGAIQDWAGDVNFEAERLQRTFKHVYWAQPTLDSVVFAATDGALSANNITPHPLHVDEIVDNAVQLWQTGGIGLDVVEQSDKWNYLERPGSGSKKQQKVDIKSLLNFDPEAFYEQDEQL